MNDVFALIADRFAFTILRVFGLKGSVGWDFDILFYVVLSGNLHNLECCIGFRFIREILSARLHILRYQGFSQVLSVILDYNVAIRISVWV